VAINGAIRRYACPISLAPIAAYEGKNLFTPGLAESFINIGTNPKPMKPF